MNIEQFKKEAENIKKGAYVKVTYKSEPKTTKEFKDVKVEKITSAVVRIGIKYQNLKENKNIVTGSLNYGTWEKTLENYIIEYNGTYYLRLYTSKSPKHKAHTQYLLNGKETTKQDLINKGIIKDNASRETNLYNIKLNNLIKIGA